MNFQPQGHIGGAGGVVISGNFSVPGNYASPRTSPATVRYTVASARAVPVKQVASPVVSPRKSLAVTTSMPTLRLESTARAFPHSFSRQTLSEDESYGQGVEVKMSEFTFRCSEVLGRGSYGEVWRAHVVSGPTGLQQVALKQVGCRNKSELQQAIFEVQVLLALERAAVSRVLQVPRCICYKVDSSSNGWKVKTAMTVVPGESLDHYVRRAPLPGTSRMKAVHRGMALAAKLMMDIGPSLQLLSPIAWHRDVNSHNILVDGASDEVDNASILESAAFWLIDFGLAVDSQSWVSESGKWRTEYIGGDSRYWPPSSWIMHLVGPEGFDGRPDLCQQYQRRLDVHGLGITALELLCGVALACPSEENLGAWSVLFQCWQSYHDKVWTWWAAVYEVFSSGGDLAPVQARLVQERIVDQLLVLLTDIRSSLRACAAEVLDERERRLLHMIADMLDEGRAFELSEIRALRSQVQVSRLTRSASAIMPSKAEAVQRQSSSLDGRGWKVQRAVSTPSQTVQGSLVSVERPPPLQSQPAGCFSNTHLPWNGVPLPAMETKVGRKEVEVVVQGVRSSAPAAEGEADPLGRTMRRPPAAGDPSVWLAIHNQRDAVMAKIEDVQAAFTTRLDKQLASLEARLSLLRKMKVAKALASASAQPQNGETARLNVDLPDQMADA